MKEVDIMENIKQMIGNYYSGRITLDKVVSEAKRLGLSSDELIELMSRWRILLESQHAEDLTALTKEAEAAIKAMMGDKK